MKVGLIGWRGMVGSVLLQRMQEENDFALGFEPVFFSTSQAGQPAPMNAGTLKDASDIAELKKLTKAGFEEFKTWGQKFGSSPE